MRFPVTWTIKGLSSVAVAILVFCMSADLSAQRIIAQGAASPKRDKLLYEQYTKQLKQKKKAAENRIAMRLADIDSACQLTDAQQKKLIVASKGAVKSFMTKATAETKKAARQIGFKFEPDNPPKVPEEDDDDKNLAIGQIFIEREVANDASVLKVENEKIWRMTIKKILNEDQKKRLQPWTEERAIARQKAAVGNFIARVDLKLLLSPEQREKLTEWIDKKYGERLAANIDNGTHLEVRGFVQLNQNQDFPPAVLNKTVAKILSRPQRDVWSMTFQKELNRLKPVVEAEAAGVFNFLQGLFQ